MKLMSRAATSRVDGQPGPRRQCQPLARRSRRSRTRSTRATAASHHPRTRAAGLPSRRGSSDGSARTTPRSPPARRAAACPWRPSHATSRSRIPCPRSRSAVSRCARSRSTRRRCCVACPGRIRARPPAFGARRQLVAQPDVREGAANHDFMVAAPRAVGIEVGPLHAVLDQPLARRTLHRDVARPVRCGRS